MQNDCSCPGEYCKMCNGQACNKCGVGCWNNSLENLCEHDVIERHEQSKIDDLVRVYK